MDIRDAHYSAAVAAAVAEAGAAAPPQAAAPPGGHEVLASAVVVTAPPAAPVPRPPAEEDARSVGAASARSAGSSASARRKRCAVDGCERPRERQGYCLAHSARFNDGAPLAAAAAAAAAATAATAGQGTASAASTAPSSVAEEDPADDEEEPGAAAAAAAAPGRERSVSDVELSALIKRREDELKAVERKLQALQAQQNSDETPAVAALRIMQDMSRAAYAKAVDTKRSRRRAIVSKGSVDLVTAEYTRRAVRRFHARFERVVRSELAREGSLASDTLCVMVVLTELRQLVLTVFDYGKRQRASSDHIFRELAFLNRTTQDLENVRQRLFFQQTNVTPSERMSPRSPRVRLGPAATSSSGYNRRSSTDGRNSPMQSAAASPRTAGRRTRQEVLAHSTEVTLEFLEERMELFSDEDRGRLGRLVPEVRDLAKQVELLRAQQHEEALILLFLAETFGKTLSVVARSTELRHKMFTPLLEVFSHARGSVWTALRCVHGLRLAQTEDEIARPHVPAEWVEYHTDAGVPYYVNKRTGETRWEQPFAE